MNPASRSEAPWESNPYRLVSWWEMELFSATEFYNISRSLQILVSSEAMPEGAFDSVSVESSCRKLGLALSLAQLERLGKQLMEFRAFLRECASSPDEYKASKVQEAQKMLDRLNSLGKELQDRIHDELAQRLFLYVTPEDARFYSESESIFSKVVFEEWPTILEDASEASKCFALSRYTAAVFHLMRIMEFTVQKLGDKLGVQLASEKRWQDILNLITAPIKALDHRLPETKTLAAAAAHLYNVKVAWRNEVMHPKATYTREEAKGILDGVKVFVEELVSI